MADLRFDWDPAKAAANQGFERDAVLALKQSVTIRLDLPTIEYFKRLATETEIPYQTLINMFLRDCASTRKRPSVRWAKRATGAA